MDYRKVYTPQHVAQLLVQLVEPKPELVWLEPSAGIGNIASEIPKHGIIHCVEKDPEAYKELKHTYSYLESNHGFNTIFCDDFLTMDFKGNRYNRIIANPPFNDGDENGLPFWNAHIEKMYSLLAPIGKMVAIIPKLASLNDDVNAITSIYLDAMVGKCVVGTIPYTNWFKPEKFPIQILKIVKN